MKQGLSTAFALLCVGGNCLVRRKTHSGHSFALCPVTCAYTKIKSLRNPSAAFGMLVLRSLEEGGWREMIVADTQFPCTCVQTHSCGTLMNHPGDSLLPWFVGKTGIL